MNCETNIDFRDNLDGMLHHINGDVKNVNHHIEVGKQPVQNFFD